MTLNKLDKNLSLKIRGRLLICRTKKSSESISNYCSTNAQLVEKKNFRITGKIYIEMRKIRNRPSRKKIFSRLRIVYSEIFIPLTRGRRVLAAAAIFDFQDEF